jgi:hypothetical protein
MVKQSGKLRLIQQTISDHTSYRKILGRLIDAGFADALKTFYADGALSQENYEK